MTIREVLQEMRRILPDDANDDSHTAFVYLNPRELREWIQVIEAEAKANPAAILGRI